MSDPTNNETPTPTDPPTTLELVPEAPPQQVRLGGQAGVRVSHQGGMQTTRVSASQGGVPDCKQVPVAVLAEVRDVLDSQLRQDQAPLTAAEAFSAVRDLLAPWL